MTLDHGKQVINAPKGTEKKKKEETRRRMMRHRQRKGGIRNVHSERSEQEMEEKSS